MMCLTSLARIDNVGALGRCEPRCELSEFKEAVLGIEPDQAAGVTVGPDSPWAS